MKTVFTTILFSVYLTAFAQDSQVLGRITESQAENLEFASQYANYTDFTEIELNDGNIISIGDTVKIGTPATSNQRITSSSMGVRSQSTFTTLQFGSPINGAFIAALTGDDGALLSSWAASEMVVERVLVSHTKLSRNSTLNVGLVVKEMNGPRRVYAYNASRSISLGELELLKRLMTREEAIAKLKESKDLLDLGLLSQEEYDALKEELGKIIKGG